VTLVTCSVIPESRTRSADEGSLSFLFLQVMIGDGFPDVDLHFKATVVPERTTMRPLEGSS
jgi:hypothetical protein